VCSVSHGMKFHITAIIDGTEQPTKKPVHIEEALNSWSGKKSAHTVQKLVVIK
jgi:hypothetical protein